jgi:hypothetical protein
MTLLFRMLLFAAKSRRGRRLLILGALSAIRLIRNPRARHAYIQAWRIASDPRRRKAAVKVVRSSGRKTRRR